ncbi:MAG TPA: hypothetical protein VF681_13320 [Abditibacteriaceae bacterium]|jgi:hypothetical protein
MSEHKIQNVGRNALVNVCLNFRANVGQGWTGEITKLPNGDIYIKNPRPFNTGLPPGFSDTFGLTPVTVTQDMVGRVLGVFHAIEYKSATGKARTLQAAFLEAVRRNGGRAGIARNEAEAIAIALGHTI